MRGPFVAGLLLLGLAGSARAQAGPRVGLSVEGGAAVSSGGAAASLPDPGDDPVVHFRPAASAALALRADLDWRRWRAELGVQVIPARLYAEFPGGGGFSIGGQCARVVELAPRLGWRVAGSGPGAGVLLLAGPSLQYWSVTLEEPRAVLALGAGVQAEAPLAPRLRLAVRGGITVGPSFLAGGGPAEGLMDLGGVRRWQGGAGLRWLLRP